MFATSLSGECHRTVNKTINQVTEPKKYHGDETPLTSYDTPSYLSLVMSANLILMILNNTPIEIGLKVINRIFANKTHTHGSTYECTY